MLRWVDGAQAAPDHLGQCRFVRAGSQQHHARRRREVVALREHGHIDDHLCSAGFVLGKACLALCIGQLAVHDHGRHTGILKGLAHALGVGDGRTEHDRLALAGLLPPMTDHGIGDRRLVQNRLDFRHVEVSGRAPNPRQLLLGADIDDEGAWRHEVAGGDQFAEGDLIRDVAENLPQSLAVTAGRCRRHPEDLSVRVLVQHPVDHTAVRRRGSVMRLIDHQQVERWYRGKMVVTRQRLHHRECGAP